MKEHFIKHFEHTIQTVDDELKKEKRDKKVGELRHIILSVYFMEAVLNYKKLKTHLISFYNEITNNENTIKNEITNETNND